VTVPSSIQRIEPFPNIEVSLLNRLPLVPTDLEQIRDSLTPGLLAEINRIALAFDPSLASEDPGALAQINPARFAEIAITVLTRDYMRRASFSGDHRYWRYTLACAICCAELGPQDDDHVPLAYAAGLLHDIGRLALISAYPEKYSNLLALADRMFATGEPFDILEYERMLFGLDHFAAGAWLATSWKLPAWLLAMVGRFNDRPAAEHRELVATVRAGTRLAHSIGFGYLESAPRTPIRNILSQLPAAWAHWKVLDQWQSGEEHLRGKIHARAHWYAGPSEVTSP
jgi:HDOD domain